MKAGDIVKWEWHLSYDWSLTAFTGVIIGSRMAKTDYEKIRIFEVLESGGTVVEVREDENGLRMLGTGQEQC